MWSLTINEKQGLHLFYWAAYSVPKTGKRLTGWSALHNNPAETICTRKSKAGQCPILFTRPHSILMCR